MGSTVGPLVRVLAFVLVSLVAASPASAADPRIEQADQLITEELRYKSGITLLERTLRDPDLTDADRIEAYRLLGVAYIARDKPQSAEAAFEALLAIDPSFTLDPRLSPKIREVFARAQNTIAPRIRDVTAIPEGRRVVVSARVEDPRAALTAVDLYARTGDDAFERYPMTRTDDRVEAVVEVPDLTRLRVDYYVVGRSEDADLVAVADATSPLSVVVARPAPLPPPPPPLAEPTPIYQTWWFWTVAGVVVIGAVVGGIAVASGGERELPGTLPPVEL